MAPAVATLVNANSESNYAGSVLARRFGDSWLPAGGHLLVVCRRLPFLDFRPRPQFARQEANPAWVRRCVATVKCLRVTTPFVYDVFLIHATRHC